MIICEGFYQHPEEVREYALRQSYYYPYESDDDVSSGRLRYTWMASRFQEAAQCPFKSSAALREALEVLTGDSIDLDHWNSGFPLTRSGKPDPACERAKRSCLWNCCFHFKPDTGQELGQGVHNHVFDKWNGVGPNGWAGLIYLSPVAPLSGGLKLWRNRDPLHTFDWMTPKEDWEQVDDLGNVYNRLILCRGDIPHSGANGWDDRLSNGRLYQTFFFRVKREPIADGLRIEIGPTMSK